MSLGNNEPIKDVAKVDEKLGKRVAGNTAERVRENTLAKGVKDRVKENTLSKGYKY